MIRKLRIKLIAAAMSSLVLVLIVLFSVITFWNYNEIVQGADKILDILSENDGSFPIKDHRPGALDDLSSMDKDMDLKMIIVIKSMILAEKHISYFWIMDVK